MNSFPAWQYARQSTERMGFTSPDTCTLICIYYTDWVVQLPYILYASPTCAVYYYFDSFVCKVSCGCGMYTSGPNNRVLHYSNVASMASAEYSFPDVWHCDSSPRRPTHLSAASTILIAPGGCCAVSIRWPFSMCACQPMLSRPNGLRNPQTSFKTTRCDHCWYIPLCS